MIHNLEANFPIPSATQIIPVVDLSNRIPMGIAFFVGRWRALLGY